MPQMTTVAVPANTWTQITNANATSISFQNVSAGYTVFIKGTVGATPPSNFEGAIQYAPMQRETNIALSNLFPGVSGANRIYAWCSNEAQVSVNHA